MAVKLYMNSEDFFDKCWDIFIQQDVEQKTTIKNTTSQRQ